MKILLMQNAGLPMALIIDRQTKKKEKNMCRITNRRQHMQLTKEMYLSWNTKQIIDACIIQSTGKTGEIV